MRLRSLLLLPVALVLGFLLLAFAEAWRDPIIVRYAVSLPGWPVGQPPVRMLVIGDTHVGYPDMPLWRIRRIVAQANAVGADIIVMTGDYDGSKLFEGEHIPLHKAIEPLKDLRAPMGVWAVNGNHDEVFWTPHLFERWGSPTPLNNRWADVGPFLLLGLGDPWKGDFHPVEAYGGLPPSRPVVAVVHQPDMIDQLTGRADLVLSGHTHGAQVHIPHVPPPMEYSVHGELFRRGLIDWRGRKLLVTSGIGTSELPLRFRVAPEMVLVTLGPQPSTGRKSGTER